MAACTANLQDLSTIDFRQLFACRTGILSHFGSKDIVNKPCFATASPHL